MWLKKQSWRLVKATDVVRAVTYNQWSRRGEAKPLLLDIGARGGPSGKWRALHRMGLADLCLVEPDQEAAAQIRSEFPSATVIADPLGAREGEQAVLNLCTEPGVSSMLEPDTEMLRGYSFASAFDIKARVAVSLRRFDALMAAGAARQPDYVKIDVQGYELEVLRGFGDALDRVLAVELEAQFLPLYRGQPLIGEIYAYMVARGFGLCAVRPQSNFDEFNIVEANFFFARDRRGLAAEQRRKLELWRRLMRIPSSLEMTLATG